MERLTTNSFADIRVFVVVKNSEQYGVNARCGSYDTEDYHGL